MLVRFSRFNRFLGNGSYKYFTSSAYKTENISPNVLRAQYAVGGQVVVRAEKMVEENKKVIMCNIGNPQEFGQLPFTYYRQVLAGCICPSLLENERQQSPFPDDVIDRCERILAETKSNNIGAYTHAQGVPIIRENVCDFIQARDGGIRPEVKDIFLTNGASGGIIHVLLTLISDVKHGILTPVPQYPLYSATIAAFGGSKIDYQLDEKNCWSFEIGSVERAIADAKKKGIEPRAITMINPGNPTGNVLSLENIREIIDFAAKENLIILADEVYQENVYNSDRPFYSFSSVLQSMMESDDEYKKVGIFSFHSVSKGIAGECGLRGGYMHLSNIHQSGNEQLYKLSSIISCANIAGQIAVDLMCKPLEPSSVSYELYKYEYEQLYASLQRRANIVSVELNKIPGIDCQYVDGALYAFPNICIPEGAVKESELKGFECADEFYCMELLENAGICCVPGSGFGQSEGSYHLRTTILPPEDEIVDVVQKIAVFHEQFCNKYSIRQAN